MKHEFSVIRENSKILIGDGENTFFWTDKWGGPPLCDILQIPPNIHQFLQSRVSDYIQNFQWNIPWQLQTLFPNLKNLVEQVTIPVVHKCDKLIWTNSASGDLSLKEAYLFKSQHIQKIHWAKTIWSKDIPPSKALITSRIMHDKMPTDEKLRERGCNLPSIYNLCLQQEETTFHLFFDCSFSIRLWTWFSQILNLNLHFNDVEEIWNLCDRSWTPQCKLVIKAAIVNILTTIWFVRNQARFNNKTIQWRSAISLVSSSVSFTGNNTTLTSYSSKTNFQILKKFDISIHPPKAPVIKEVIWNPPLINWTKANTDGSATSTNSACGIIFRDSNAVCLLCMSENLGPGNAFSAELCGAMRAIEVAYQKQWFNLWLETDSQLVVLAFKNSSCVPWTLRNRWENCNNLLISMNFMVTHIYREGNQCADSLANIGLSTQGLFLGEFVPSLLASRYSKDKLGMPSFRFVSFRGFWLSPPSLYLFFLFSMKV